MRIEAYLQSHPDEKVVSVSLHPAPTKEEGHCLGVLMKYLPNRYEHVEANFREERGLKTLQV